MYRFTNLLLISFVIVLVCTTVAAIPHTTEIEYHGNNVDDYIRQSDTIVINGVQMERRNLLAKIVEHKIKKAIKKGIKKGPKKLLRAGHRDLKKLGHIID